ncbi:energy transducer TonB [Rhizosphaericola mali]|uniref:TonB C-terminal domain-containing protein n=1 Tax=Rhizosphaericola mali TaxID=2545455 RepID=A0A5P2G3Z2_9BACT|nr:energy transducer TonB [Rhizosphaericola mali]QES89927.1 hypothetical protein E0W69_015095 [Rhizosphaericola mali]
MTKRHAIFILLIWLISLPLSTLKAQKEELRHIYYFDSLDHATVEDSSVFQNKQYKTEEGWRIEYWERREQPQFILYRSETKSDTSYKPKWVKILRYYKNGTPMEYKFLKSGIPQSTIHYDKYAVKNAEIKYKNGRIVQQLGWDSLGHSIVPFKYEQKAQFSISPKGWQDFISKNLNADIPRDKNAPIGNYKVIVRFSIDTLGNVENVKTIQDPGYGTAEEAMRVIKNSPKWKPAIFLNKKIIYTQSQLITFQVLDNPSVLFEDTIIKYTDETQKYVSAKNATHKIVDYKVNDTTRVTTILNIATNKFVGKASTIFSKDGHIYVNMQALNSQGNTITLTKTVDNKIKRILKYHPNGRKSSDVQFGENGIPINTRRWDENGNLIK